MLRRRLLPALGILLLVLVLAAVLIGFLAYGMEPDRSGEVRVASLSAPAALGWADDGRRVVDAPDAEAAAAALGYAHAIDDTWSMVLWRQVATAGLSGWFGEEVEGLDEHVARLGFASDARRAYAALPDSARRVLDAYSAGANAALRRPSVQQADELVLVGATADAWAPWHALAVERLVAYLGTDPLSDAVTADSFAVQLDTLGYPLPNPQRVGPDRTELRRFALADSTLRAYLHLGTFGRSYAYATTGMGSAPVFASQISYGTSAVPLVREVTFRRGGRAVTAATIPGTLMVPAGSGPSGAWAVLLSDRLDAASVPFPDGLTPTRQRLVLRDGSERLVTAYQQPGALYLGTPPARPASAPPSPPADSTVTLAPAPPADDARWSVRWRGFGAPQTDALVWSRMLDAALAGGTPDPSALALVPAAGLVMGADGTAQVLGAPAVLIDLPGGAFIGGDPVLRYAADRLAASIAADTLLTPARLAADTYSAWAAERLPPLLDVIAADTTLRATLAGDTSDSLGTPGPRRLTGTAARYQNGLAYLSGWNYRYDPDAIAGTIFDTWNVVHREQTGRDLVASADSASVIRSSLRLALARLVDDYGEEPSTWRWQNAVPAERAFPVWSVDDDRFAAERYAPAPLEDGGHPTALLAGPSPAFPDQPAVATWTAWTTPGSDVLYVRHPTVATRGFLARYVETRDPSIPHPMDAGEDVRMRLRLVPARAQ